MGKREDFKAEVKKVWEQMKAENKYPSAKIIRERLGNRGSYSTLGKYVAEFEQKLRPKRDIEQETSIQEALETLTPAMTKLWKEALKQARKEIEPEIEELRKELRQSQQTNRENLDEIEALEIKAEKEITQVQKKLIEQGEDLQRIERENAQLKSGLQLSEQTRINQETTIQELTKQKQEVLEREKQVITDKNFAKTLINQANERIERQKQEISELSARKEEHHDQATKTINNLLDKLELSERQRAKIEGTLCEIGAINKRKPK